MTPDIQKSLTLLDNFMRHEQCGVICKAVLDIIFNSLFEQVESLEKRLLFDIEFVKRQHENHETNVFEYINFIN